jgi:hypothetical protein
MRAFIEANFKMMDLDGDGCIGLAEFRYNCIQRIATDDIKIVDDAFNQLLNVSRANIFLALPSHQFQKLHQRLPSRESLV